MVETWNYKSDAPRFNLVLKYYTRWCYIGYLLPELHIIQPYLTPDPAVITSSTQASTCLVHGGGIWQCLPSALLRSVHGTQDFSEKKAWHALGMALKHTQSKNAGELMSTGPPLTMKNRSGAYMLPQLSSSGRTVLRLFHETPQAVQQDGSPVTYGAGNS